MSGGSSGDGLECDALSEAFELGSTFLSQPARSRRPGLARRRLQPAATPAAVRRKRSSHGLTAHDYARVAGSERRSAGGAQKSTERSKTHIRPRFGKLAVRVDATVFGCNP
jgi:hypothetical protein